MLTADEPALDLCVLEEIQRRVLWLAVRIVDAANRDRENHDGVKVGGHQASSASLVTVMTALWFAHLDAGDRVSVKPHASPVFHAIQYLLGNLDRSYLPRLRARGGLQSYPSRTKDPDRAFIDFSTGSVGLGAAAPLFAAVVRRYVDAHFGARPPSRFIAILGDAELDEGNVWEAIADPATQGLGNALWIVDFNRQSLDRVVPGVRIAQWREQFVAAGWHVVEAKYGRRLGARFVAPGGTALREWIDTMANERYQSLFAHSGEELRRRFLDGAPHTVVAALAGVDAADLAPLIQDLGGHDLATLLDALTSCDRVTDRPSVIFAYTVKGFGLPIAGHPRNHSALLTPAQVDTLREATGLTRATEWDRFEPGTATARWCEHRAAALARTPPEPRLSIAVPERVEGRGTARPTSTQETFGRLLLGLARHPEVGRHLVTTAPDVATSTHLAGFINRAGIFSPSELPDWDEPDALFRWRQSPQGQHVELGISEMNLFLLLGQLGLSWDLSAQPLLPIGTVYDPFVCRGLDAFIHGAYSGARFIVVGTPSGVTLAPEGGAHQSTITPAIGLGLPGVAFCEPAYGGALDWLLCDALAKIAAAADRATTYLRLSTRPLDQAPFEAARERLGDARLRDAVLAGGYRLVDATAAAAQGAPVVHLAASGAVLPEVVAAAAELADEGVLANVVDITSLDRLYVGWHERLRRSIETARPPGRPSALEELFSPRAPVVTVHDAASHTMAWVGAALGVPTVPLGVDAYGQSGSVAELYEIHGLLPGYIVNAALTALSLPAG